MVDLTRSLTLDRHTDCVTTVSTKHVEYGCPICMPDMLAGYACQICLLDMLATYACRLMLDPRICRIASAYMLDMPLVMLGCHSPWRGVGSVGGLYIYTVPTPGMVGLY